MKVYYQEDGFFPGTFNFKEDVDDTEPIDWTVFEGTNTEVLVLSSYDSHNKVLKLYDNSAVSYCYADTPTFTATEDDVIEFWFQIDDVGYTVGYRFKFIEATAVLFEIFISDDDLHNDNGLILADCLTINTWHHLRIACDDSANTYDVYLDFDQIASAEAYDANSTTGLDQVRFQTGTNALTEPFTLYIDAVGHKSDSKYDVGDNEFEDYHYYARTLLDDVAEWPSITTEMDRVSQASVACRDYEGALYSTWKDYDFKKMGIDDHDENQIFVGYLTAKKFTRDSMFLTISGFGILLSWTPFNTSFMYAEGRMEDDPMVDGETVDVYDDLDGDGDYAGAGEDFDWDVNQWARASDRKGLIIESPQGTVVEHWKVSTVTVVGEYHNSGDGDAITDTQTYGGDYHWWDNAGITNINGCIGYYTVNESWDDAGGDTEDPIPESKFIKEIEINYNYVFGSTIGIFGTYCAVKLQIWDYDNEIWVWMDQIVHHWPGHSTRHDTVQGDPLFPLNPFIIPGDVIDQDPTDFLYDSDADDSYDQLYFRWKMSGNGAGPGGSCEIDYLTARVKYHADVLGAVMAPIVANTATDITCANVDWDNTGVGTDDKFKIGESSHVILDQIFSKAKIEYELKGLDDEAEMYLHPDGAVGGETWSTGNSPHWAELDGSSAIRAEEQLGDDNDVETFNLELTDLDVVPGTVTSVKLSAYCWNNNSVSGIDLDFSFDGGSTWEGYEAHLAQNPYAWEESTFTPTSNLSLGDVWKFQARIRAECSTVKSAISCSELKATVYYTSTPFEKFSARDYKGSFCYDALQKVCKLEGAHWAEDHENETIVVSKPADFEDTEVDLDSTDYDHDWEFNDLCNSIKKIKVWGSAEIGVTAEASGDASSLIQQQIIDEGIATFDNALAIAEAEMEKFGSKAPSIKLTLNGVNSALKCLYTVGITFERPTIGADDYPIRKIERSRRGIEGIKTVIYVGLGYNLDWGEQLGNQVVSNAMKAHDAHQARLLQG